MSEGLNQNLPATLRTICTRPLFVMRLDVAKILDVGETPGATRRIGLVTGGVFEGERLSGDVVSGNDWQALRHDGSTTLDVRLILKIADGALLTMTYQGLRHGPPEVIARINRGENSRSCRLLFPHQSGLRDGISCTRLDQWHPRDRHRTPLPGRTDLQCFRSALASFLPTQLLCLVASVFAHRCLVIDARARWPDVLPARNIRRIDRAAVRLVGLFAFAHHGILPWLRRAANAIRHQWLRAGFRPACDAIAQTRKLV